MNTPAHPLQKALSLLEKSIKTQPRTLQRTIGPSEIGDPCIHCKAARLAGWTRIDTTTPWLPFIGTAIHAQLEKIFTNLGDEWKTETKVTVGTMNGTSITGTCDLYHVPSGTVIDWKTTSTSGLTNAKNNNIRPQHITQAHLYGRGWENQGHKVNTVALIFLPRTGNLHHAATWHQPYNPTIAIDALAEITALDTAITTLRTHNPTSLDEWISGLPRAEGCYNCPRYKDFEQAPSLLDTLITPTKGKNHVS